jgi:hypothetical protein
MGMRHAAARGETCVVVLPFLTRDELVLASSGVLQGVNVSPQSDLDVRRVLNARVRSDDPVQGILCSLPTKSHRRLPS